MTESLAGMGLLERQITDLLLQGCNNTEIAQQLNMKHRTVKAHFNRLFLRFGITDGIKRVKLARRLLAGAKTAGSPSERKRILTERERRVVELVSQGLTNGEVGALMGTTEYVIKNRLQSIYDKLGLWNRVELTLWYEARQEDRECQLQPAWDARVAQPAIP